MKLMMWLKERDANARRLAAGKTGADRAGWMEDAGYFRAAVEAVDERDRLLADNALLSATEQRLRTLLDGADRRAVANGKDREELAAQAADVAGERAANAGLTAEIEVVCARLTRLSSRLDDALFVLGMVDKNNRIDAGEKGKAWSGLFVVEEVRRVLGGA